MTMTIYPTPQSLQDKVDEYFSWCFVPVYSKQLDRTVYRVANPPTMSGLARYLGFSSRAQLMEYKSGRDEMYDEIISLAKLRVEEFLETQLITTKGNAAGVIFALKNNAKWEDQTKQQITGADDKPLVFSWDAKGAHDVINVDAVEPSKQTPLPVAPLKLESTSEIDGGK